MIELTDEILPSLLDFIKERPTIPPDVERVIVSKHEDHFRKNLLGLKVKPSVIHIIKEVLKKNYYKSLIQPGEAVGIICSQAIGEKTTQSSLNNFHSTGLDTGSTSQIDNLQNIINASKTKKKENAKFLKVRLYPKTPCKDLFQFKLLTTHYLEAVYMKNLIFSTEKRAEIPEVYHLFNDNVPAYGVKLELSLSILFDRRIDVKVLKKVLFQYNVFVIPYCLVDEQKTTMSVYFDIGEEPFFEFFRNIKNIQVTGCSDIKFSVFSRDFTTQEWFVECLCSCLSFKSLYKVFDMNRLVCDSVNDINNLFGILVAKELIIYKCVEIIPNIDISHYKLLAMRMTKNGIVEPLTRYTMRNNASPLTKASFEESFETFLKASKFQEKEEFLSTSSNIICGKKPRMGTYFNDVLLNPKLFNLKTIYE